MSELDEKGFTFSREVRIRVGNPNLRDWLREAVFGPQYIRDRVRIDPTQIIDLDEILGENGKPVFVVLNGPRAQDPTERKADPTRELIELMSENLVDGNWAKLLEIANSLLKDFRGSVGCMHVHAMQSSMIGDLNKLLDVTRGILRSSGAHQDLSRVIDQVIKDLALEA